MGGTSQFPILGVPLYLCIHPLTQNYQILRGNTYAEGFVFRGQLRSRPKWAEPQRSPISGVLYL